MEIIDIIRAGLIIQMNCTAVFALLFFIAIVKHPEQPIYALPTMSDDKKAENAQKYEKFESEKYIWRQQVKATGAITALLMTLFCFWSLIFVFIDAKY